MGFTFTSRRNLLIGRMIARIGLVGRIELLGRIKVAAIAGAVMVASVSPFVSTAAHAQEQLPTDNGYYTYHTAPRYRESESHPLRILGYIFHPIGWVAREGIFRPLSYFASSTPKRRSIMGYREPYDWRETFCYDNENVPDCRTVPPLNYARETREHLVRDQITGREVYFPNVNFDFNRRSLNAEGRGKVAQIADILGEHRSVHVVLQGHTDYRGSEEYNRTLGMDRANAVKNELVKLGVSSDRLATVSFGETSPLLDEKTDAARAVNRRVEVKDASAVTGAGVRDGNGVVYRDAVTLSEADSLATH